MSELTQVRLKQLLSYNKDTGEFTRMVFRGGQQPGQIAGCLHTNQQGGYQFIKIRIDGRLYPAHRLAFLYMLNRWPHSITDHINGNSLDNAWANLRDASFLINNRNTSIALNNTSGVTGVSWNKAMHQWKSYINVTGVNIYLGSRPDYFEAICLRKSAERSYGFHLNHGRSKLAQK